MADTKQKKKKLRITNIKAKLAAGSLTAAEQQKLVDRITKLGGKVNLANFPKASDAAAPPTTTTPTSTEPVPGSNEAVDAELQAGLDYGKKLGDEQFAEGSLGRVDTTQSQEVLDTIEASKANLEGLTPEEQLQLQQKGELDANRQAQQARRELLKRLAITNQRGGVAAGLLADIDRERIRAQRGITSDVFNENINRKRDALTQYQALLLNQQEFGRQGNIFNLQQQAAEVAGRSGATLTGAGLYTSIGAAQRGEQYAQDQLTYQKEEAERTRQFQLKILKRQQRMQRDLFNQARSDAGAF